jgi:Fic family protein
MLSYQLTDKNVSSLKDLAQQAAKRSLLIEQLGQDELSYIRRNVLISTIGASTRIENAVLTDAEIDWLDTVLSKDAKTSAYDENREAVLNKLSKDKERSIDEVAGSRAMLNLIYSEGDSFFPLTETALRGLHNELLQHYAPAHRYKGSYKDVPNRVVRKNKFTGEETIVLEPSAPGPITDTAMRELVYWYNEALLKSPWTIAVATEFVFRFLAIHPFQDGNGRVGRALFLLALLTSPDENLRAVSPYLSIDRYIEKHREDYYMVLKRVSNGVFHSDPEQYNYEPFFRFMIKIINEAFKDFDFYRDRYALLQELSPSATQVLNAFREKPEIQLQNKDIVKDTKVPRQTVTLALKNLVEKGFIQKRGKGPGVRYQLVF